MKKIITFSGHSQRFLDAGFTIKPLIKIGEQYVYDLAIKNLSEFDSDNSGEDFIFILKKSDCDNYEFNTILSNKYPKSKIMIIDDHRKGPVFSILEISNVIPDDEDIIIGYCDLFINWNFRNFYDFCTRNNYDGVVATHGDWHPHREYNNYFCYLRVSNNDVLELQEKKAFTDNPINELASSGVYFFKSGKLMKKYFNELIDKNIRVNNEFYVTMPYNLMIKDNLKVGHYLHDNYLCLGTPKDVTLINHYISLVRIFDNSLSKVVNYFTANFKLI